MGGAVGGAFLEGSSAGAKLEVLVGARAKVSGRQVLSEATSKLHEPQHNTMGSLSLLPHPHILGDSEEDPP